MHIVSSSAAETPNRLTVWDAFGGSGADAIAFLMTGYRKVDVYELDRARAQAISQRLKSYFDAGLYNVTVDNSMTVGKLKKYDIVYADPPWARSARRCRLRLRRGRSVLQKQIAR